MYMYNEKNFKHILHKQIDHLESSIGNTDTIKNEDILFEYHEECSSLYVYCSHRHLIFLLLLISMLNKFLSHIGRNIRISYCYLTSCSGGTIVGGGGEADPLAAQVVLHHHNLIVASGEEWSGDIQRFLRPSLHKDHSFE